MIYIAKVATAHRKIGIKDVSLEPKWWDCPPAYFFKAFSPVFQYFQA
jgi:hypothetical protein